MGSKSTPAPPDYTPVAEASEQAAEYGYRAASEQLQFSRDVYNELSPLYQRIANTQMDAQQQQMDQAADYYNYWKGTYQPLEQGIVADAQKFNTEAYREGLAQQARTDTERAFASQDATTQRQMMSMGVNPNSGRFQGLSNQQNLAQAAASGAAMNSTRQQAEQMGYARLMDAAGLGRNMPGASTGAYTAATNAGSSAANTMGMPSQQYTQGAQGAYGLGLQGANTAVNGYSNILSSQTSVYGSQMDANAASTAGLYGALGTGVGLAAGGGFFGSGLGT